MGIIREEIEIIGTRKNKRILALFDSGASRNYIRTKLEDGDTPDDIGFHVYDGKHDAILANGEIAPGERVRFKEMRIRGCSVKEPAFVMMETLLEHAIIGVEVMQTLGIALDPHNEKIVIRENG